MVPLVKDEGERVTRCGAPMSNPGGSEIQNSNTQSFLYQYTNTCIRTSLSLFLSLSLYTTSSLRKAERETDGSTRRSFSASCAARLPLSVGA